MGLWARWRHRREEKFREEIMRAAAEDDAEDAAAARDRSLGLRPAELPANWPTDRIGDWYWDGSGWRHKSGTQ